LNAHVLKKYFYFLVHKLT